MSEKLAAIMAEVLDVPAASITDASSPGTIPTWDSVAHLNLVLTLEAEYGVEFSPDDAMRMTSADAIKAVLAEQGVTA
jgi:acyl carrier protein